MTWQREDFWKGSLVVLNISIRLERPWNACNSLFLDSEVSLKHLFVYLFSSTALTPLSLVYRTPFYLWSFTKSKSSSVPGRTHPAGKVQHITIITTAHADFWDTAHRVLKFKLVILALCLWVNYKLLHIPFSSKSASPPWEDSLAPLHQNRGKHCH